MRSGPIRRSARGSWRQLSSSRTVEELECRRLLCFMGVDESGGDPHEIHLYDASGHHLALDGLPVLPDAGTIDIPPGAAGQTGPSLGIPQTGPSPVIAGLPQAADSASLTGAT